MKRTIVFWLYFVIAIVLGIYFATRIIMTGLGHGNLATIHNITITTDDSDMDMVAVQTVAAGGLGARTNSLNIDSLNRRIATVPGIKNMFLGGEGIFNTVETGPGHVGVQTRRISNVAAAISRYIPTGN